MALRYRALLILAGLLAAHRAGAADGVLVPFEFEIGQEGRFSDDKGRTHYPTRVFQILDKQSMIVRLGRTYFIVKGRSTEGLADDKVVGLAGWFKVTTTRKYVGTTYYVVEPAKEPKPPPPPPRPARVAPRLVVVKSYGATDAYEQADALHEKRVRILDQAEVKRTSRGVYAVFSNPRGKRILTVSLKADAGGGLFGKVKEGDAVKMKLNLEATVDGVRGGYLILADVTPLPADAPEGYVFTGTPIASDLPKDDKLPRIRGYYGYDRRFVKGLPKGVKP